MSIDRRHIALPRVPRAGSEGFTLIEALVALLILAIASSALVVATGAHVERVSRLEVHAIAELVAEDRLTDLRLSHVRPVETRDRVDMGQYEWIVTQAVIATSDPDLIRVKISVSPKGQYASSVSLDGFLDTGVAP